MIGWFLTGSTYLVGVGVMVFYMAGVPAHRDCLAM